MRSTWLLKTVSEMKKPVLFIGESGTAKTVTIQGFLNELPAASNLVLNMNFSSRTSSMDVQRGIEDCIEKRTKDTYGPPMGRTMICMIDDMNMPK